VKGKEKGVYKVTRGGESLHVRVRLKAPLLIGSVANMGPFTTAVKTGLGECPKKRGSPKN
jgi:hypothetical protein